MSLNVTQAASSMAPVFDSGMKIWSYFPPNM